jgi:hypothetical protein
MTRALPCTLFVLSVPVLIAQACSGKSEPAPVSDDQAAADAANAFCSRVSACVPALTSLQWGDASTCTSKYKNVLLGTLHATGTSATPASLEACAQAIPGASCDDLLDRNLPDPCRAKAGSLMDGQACGDNSQCTGKMCNIAPGKICGVCSAPAAAGAACQSNEDCDYGLDCVGAAAMKVCTARAAAGQPCDGAHTCLPTLACKAGTCGTPDPADTACVAGKDTCDTAHGVFCNPISSKCVKVTFAKPGGTCGIVSDGIVLCESGGTDISTSCTGFKYPATPTGTCAAPAADGMACNDATGPTCVPPSICVNGACQVKDPSGCR